MTTLKNFALGVALGLLAIGFKSALAADMPLPPQIQQVSQLLPNVRSGWYLRGDVGYRWGLVAGAAAPTGFSTPANSSLGDGFTGGGGVGVKSGWIRADVTADYAAPVTYNSTGAGASSARIQATTVLFNGYIDLGTWFGLTPYIGAGAGAANVRTSDYARGELPAFVGPSSHDQWNFAWAGLAGIAYPVSRNLTLDVGYRYLNLGNVSTASDAFGSMTIRNVASNEVRVGLRWNINGLPGFW
jgi:opacity protein-like surface antigen